MQSTVEFLFDFVSAPSALAWLCLPKLVHQAGARLVMTPVVVTGIFKATGNQSPMAAFGGVKGKLEYEGLETKRFVAAHGLTAYRSNPHFPVNTLLIMRGLVAARRAGVGDAYLEAVVAAMWEQGLKMDDPEVVAGVLTKAGLDATEKGDLMALIRDPAFAQKLDASKSVYLRV